MRGSAFGRGGLDVMRFGIECTGRINCAAIAAAVVAAAVTLCHATDGNRPVYLPVCLFVCFVVARPWT